MELLESWQVGQGRVSDIRPKRSPRFPRGKPSKRWCTPQGQTTYLGGHRRHVSLCRAYGTAQCSDKLEEKSSDEQEETEHGQRKRSIGRWLTQWHTPSTALQRTEFRTKHK